MLSIHVWSKLAYANDDFSIISTSLSSLSQAFTTIVATANIDADANDYADNDYWTAGAADDEYATLEPTTIASAWLEGPTAYMGSTWRLYVPKFVPSFLAESEENPQAEAGAIQTFESSITD